MKKTRKQMMREATERSKDRYKRLRDEGWKVTTCELNPEAVSALARANEHGMTRNEAICKALVQAFPVAQTRRWD